MNESSSRARLVPSRADSGLGPSREERHREARAVAAVMWLSILVFLIVSGSLLTYQSWAFFAGDKQETTVPDVIGIPYEDAAVSVEQAGLVLRIRSEEYADDTEADLIIDQLPAPRCRVKVGRDVSVDVSLGSRTLTTPNVIGLERSEALVQLENLGLNHHYIGPRYSDIAPAGTIINQRPPAGAPIAVGESVELVTSAGPLNRAVEMPQLEGLPYEDALEVIRESRLVLRQVSRTYQLGAREVTVFRQHPYAGSRVMQGREVLLTLACPVTHESLGQRSTRVSVAVPQAAGTVRVRIVVTDRYETREAYSAEHTGPTTLEHLITTYGRTTVRVYFNNRIVREESL